MSADLVVVDNIEYGNAVSNSYRFIDNLRQNPLNTKEMVDGYRDRVLYLVNKHPFMWKAWSDMPEGVEYVRQEALRRIALIKSKGTT